MAGLSPIDVQSPPASTGVGVCNDMLEGIVERFLSMPVLSATVLVGHVTAALVRNLTSIVVMVLFGFTGVNPFVTITALAERNIERILAEDIA